MGSFPETYNDPTNVSQGQRNIIINTLFLHVCLNYYWTPVLNEQSCDALAFLFKTGVTVVDK